MTMQGIATAIQSAFAGLNGARPRFAGRLDDVDVVSAGLQFGRDEQDGSGSLDHLWFEIIERAAHGGQEWRGYRVVKLMELRYLPQEARADAALIQKTAAMLRGLCAANVELVVIDFGIFDPPIGIVQCYGVAARHAIRDSAESMARSAQATLLGAFTAQFPQSRLVPLTGDRAKWLFEALHAMPHVTSLVGSPDPRESARGGEQQQSSMLGGQRGVAQFSQQQNELLFRSLARAREEFCFVNIATPIPRGSVIDMLVALGNMTSPVASRQQGVNSIGFGVSLPLILSVGQAESAGQAYGTSQQEGFSDTAGVSHGVGHATGHAQTAGWSYVEGDSHTDGQAVTDSMSHTSGVSHSVAVSDVQSKSHTESQSVAHTSGHSDTLGWNAGASISPAGVGLSGGVSGAHTDMASTTVSHGSADSVGVSHGVTVADGSFESDTVGHATSVSAADTHSVARGVSGGVTNSQSDSLSESTSLAHGVSRGTGVSLGRTIGAMQSMGLGAGLAPSVSVSKSFAWRDENAIMLTQLLEQQLNLLREASEEGGVYSDVYILTRTDNGRRVAEAGAVQAFGGSQGVVTHLQPRRPLSQAEAEHLRLHTQCLSPSTLTETLGWLNGYAFSSILTLTQQSAYTAPGLFEEGTALTVQERIPPFAFVPDLDGEVVLGHLWSTERGELTRAPLRLSETRHFHTVFAADTGFGKTIAAERLACELVTQWHHRVVVLDFGAGWRRLINGPVPRERVDLYQLYPGAVRPFRWNFLQIGRRIDPDQQANVTPELLCNAGRMGPRQLGFLKRALRELYETYGVLTSDKKVLGNPSWNTVKSDEVAVLERARFERGLPAGAPQAGSHLASLMPFERQALAVHRSKQTDVNKLYEILKDYLEKTSAKDQASRQSLEGLLLRIEPFTRGELSMMYGGGEGSLAVEDLGLLGPEDNPADRWGLCVLEGGAEMDDYSKAVILSLVAWHLYHDSIVRRRETIGGFNRPLDIFWEEANKILTGVADTTVASDPASTAGASTTQWQAMWRDGRKYKIFLHPLVQTISQLPPGILASCNNSFFGQMKNLQDRDLAVGHLARSERGIHDEEYKRWLSRIPLAMAIVKLGWSEDVAQVEPMLTRPLRVSATEPTDAEILQRLGGLAPAGAASV